MADLIVHKRVSSLIFGIWRWSEQDHERPLVFQPDGASSQILIVDDRYGEQRELQIPLYLDFNLIFEGAPKAHVAALKSRGAKSTLFAERVFDTSLRRSRGLRRFSACLARCVT